MSEAGEMGVLFRGVWKRAGIVTSVYEDDAGFELCCEREGLVEDR